MRFLKFSKQDFALDDDAKMLKMRFRIHATIRHEISLDITKNTITPFHSEFHALQDNSNTLFALQIEFF